MYYSVSHTLTTIITVTILSLHLDGTMFDALYQCTRDIEEEWLDSANNGIAAVCPGEERSRKNSLVLHYTILWQKQVVTSVLPEFWIQGDLGLHYACHTIGEQLSKGVWYSPKGKPPHIRPRENTGGDMVAMLCNYLRTHLRKPIMNSWGIFMS